MPVSTKQSNFLSYRIFGNCIESVVPVSQVLAFSKNTYLTSYPSKSLSQLSFISSLQALHLFFPASQRCSEDVERESSKLKHQSQQTSPSFSSSWSYHLASRPSASRATHRRQFLPMSRNSLDMTRPPDHYLWTNSDDFPSSRLTTNVDCPDYADLSRVVSNLALEKSLRLTWCPCHQSLVSVTLRLRASVDSSKSAAVEAVPLLSHGSESALPLHSSSGLLRSIHADAMDVSQVA